MLDGADKRSQRPRWACPTGVDVLPLQRSGYRTPSPAAQPVKSQESLLVLLPLNQYGKH